MENYDLECDYVYGTVLPNLYEQPGELNDCWNEFTIEDGKRVDLTGLPVLVNHQEQVQCVGRVVGYEIGRVTASAPSPSSSVNPASERFEQEGSVHARVLLALDKKEPNTFMAQYVRNALANGYYRGLSLQHHYEAMPHKRLVLKTPVEVSLCREGLRPDSVIHDYFPSRRTLENMDDEHLRDFVRHYKHDNGSGGAVLASSDATSSKQVYIDDFCRSVLQKRDSVLSSFGKPRQGFVAMSADQSFQTKTNSESASSSPSPNMTEKETATSAPNSSNNQETASLNNTKDNEAATATSSAVPDHLANSKRKQPSSDTGSDTVLVTEEDVRQMPQHLVENFAKMRENEVRLRAELEATQKRAKLYDRVEAERKEDERRKARSILASLLAVLKETPMLDQDQSQMRQLQEAESLIDRDPETFNRQFEPQLKMVRACAHNLKEVQRRNDALTRVAWEAGNDEKVRQYVQRINAPSYQNTSNWTNAEGSEAFSGSVAASSSTPSSSLFLPQGQQQQQQPSLSNAGTVASHVPESTTGNGLGMNPYLPPVSGVMCASADRPAYDSRDSNKPNQYWANEAYQRSRAAGVEPCYGDVAAGGHCMIKTGRVQASANGGFVEEKQLVNAFDKRLTFGVHQFSPSFEQKLFQVKQKYHKQGFSLDDFKRICDQSIERFNRPSQTSMHYADEYM